MSASAHAHDNADNEWRNYVHEMECAARAAAVAARYEQQAAQPPRSMQPFRERMAALHHQIERRHRACARLYWRYALHVQRWSASGAASARPPFMSAVADDLGLGSTALTLFDEQRQELLTAASDDRSRAAHDLEAVVGRGPSRDVLDGLAYVVVDEPGLAARWPEYGTAAHDLGIRSVVAVPLVAGPGRLGALCVYSDRARPPADAVAAAGRIADVLANEVLLGADAPRGDETTPGGVLFDEADYLTTVNQAVGMVAAQNACTVDTALVLMRARAFADGASLPELAHRIVEEGYRLC
ncbi:GAF and ANTAR domain-containing protein [Nocardia blacklockiae]|uniref:GAF and ANTAR domain-containing protein n=1 Tax=Nocardia blacklockiae TaxID=480036 RepID=UPI0018953899|nr:GAF and ANTAR domain-containing protein [Nocardia blacklockiae]MBF6170652.1 GAF and ANTAR domain-containing protein [Nocardia blacklockiae]